MAKVVNPGKNLIKQSVGLPLRPFPPPPTRHHTAKYWVCPDTGERQWIDADG